METRKRLESLTLPLWPIRKCLLVSEPHEIACPLTLGIDNCTRTERRRANERSSGMRRGSEFVNGASSLIQSVQAAKQASLETQSKEKQQMKTVTPCGGTRAHCRQPAE